MERTYLPVTEFLISPSVLFKCLFCGVAITERYKGTGHRSTGSHCPECGATYIVDWDEPKEPTIRMAKYEERKES